MGKKKIEIKQLELESLGDIRGEISEEEKIVDTCKKPRKLIKVSECNNPGEDKTEKNKMILNKISAIEKVIEMYPSLKKDKNRIISNILTTHQSVKSTSEPKGYVLRKINIDNKVLYRDDDMNVVDAVANIAGFYLKRGNAYEYILFA